MSLSLPESHDVSVEIEGERFDGAWSNILGDLVVYYRGFTKSLPFPDQPILVAERLLEELVHENTVPIDAIPVAIPETIRFTAHRYVNADVEDEDIEIKLLVESFGESTQHSTVHAQLSWLCVNALSMVVPAWRQMCDEDIAEPAYLALRSKLLDQSVHVDLDSLSTPMIAKRNGLKVADCDACRLEPIAEGIAQTAAFIRNGDPSAAALALLAISGAYAEGCSHVDAPDRFAFWLCSNVLESSLKCESI